MAEKREPFDTGKISEILERGNTAEVKETKDGITILEVSRKIRYKESENRQPNVADAGSDDKTEKKTE